MSDPVLSHGDGLLATVDPTFVLDRPRFHIDTFTPYAALPPVYQRRQPPQPGDASRASTWVDIDAAQYEEAASEVPPDAFVVNYRRPIGHLLSLAEQFVMKQQLVWLLDALTDGGHEVVETPRGDGKGHRPSVFVSVRLKGKGAPAFTRWRIPDLHYATATDLTVHFDLPDYLAIAFSLGRQTGWRVAWVLVRYALTDDELNIQSLVDDIRRGVNQSSDQRTRQIEANLERRIAPLRRVFL